VLLCAGYFLLVSASFDAGVLLNTFYPPITAAVTFTGINLYNVTIERYQRKEITDTFGRYVSKSVVDKILTTVKRDNLKLGGHEQEVTVAFADLRGFTAMSQNLTPIELVRVLNTYLSVVIETVIDHQGVINKFGGDSVLAIWNAPITCERHALMAVKAALAVQSSITELSHQDLSLPKLNFGIGINTGKAVAGNLGSRQRLEYSVIGDTVNIASRLTGAATGGKVWIGVDTYKEIKEFIEVVFLGETEVKGRQGKIPVYEVTGLRSFEQIYEGM
jgi:adenylate cyclase